MILSLYKEVLDLCEAEWPVMAEVFPEPVKAGEILVQRLLDDKIRPVLKATLQVNGPEGGLICPSSQSIHPLPGGPAASIKPRACPAAIPVPGQRERPPRLRPDAGRCL